MRTLPKQTLPACSRSFLPTWSLVIALAMLGVYGCGEQTQIEEYTLPKGVVNLPEESTPAASSPKVPTRMMAAMVPQGQKTWFFKLMGPGDAVKTQSKNFEGLIQSINFADGNPDWKLPEGWTEEKASGGMRFATLNIPTDPPLELSVMSLPTMGDDYDEYTLENYNRWRGQVNLPPIGKDDLKDEVQEMSTKDAKALVFDLSGWQQGEEDTMRPPFAGGAPFAGGGAPRPEVAPEQPPAANLPEFDVPEGWIKTENKNRLTLATYQLAGEGEGAEVTLIPLSLLSDQLLLPNINRWRGQIGMTPITQDDVQKAVGEIQAGDKTGRYFKLEGSEKSMLVATLDQGRSTWYIKMLGDAPLVKAKEAEFKKFVQSVRFSAQ